MIAINELRVGNLFTWSLPVIKERNQRDVVKRDTLGVTMKYGNE